jgi:polysaccharide deacetylase family protein (PEP-CTERM system associated)
VSTGRFLASFDIEDWYHAENVRSSLPTSDWNALEPRVERNTHEVLDLLGEAGVKSTFFVLGWIAARYPALVRRMSDEGHEVASHSDTHRRLYDLSPDDLEADLARARETLEQLTGTPVLGLRAPTFSVNDQVLDCVARAGYWYDSSLNAFGAHDRYGSISTRIDSRLGVAEVRPGLLELPISSLVLGRVALPWGGGGYFRLLPYPVFRWGVRRRLSSSSWFMFYLHPWELDAREQAPAGLPRTLRFRAYVGRKRVHRDLRRLLADFGSARIDETLRSFGYRPPASPAVPVAETTAGLLRHEDGEPRVTSQARTAPEQPRVDPRGPEREPSLLSGISGIETVSLVRSDGGHHGDAGRARGGILARGR